MFLGSERSNGQSGINDLPVAVTGSVVSHNTFTRQEDSLQIL